MSAEQVKSETGKSKLESGLDLMDEFLNSRSVLWAKSRRGSISSRLRLDLSGLKHRSLLVAQRGCNRLTSVGARCLATTWFECRKFPDRARCRGKYPPKLCLDEPSLGNSSGECFHVGWSGPSVIGTLIIMTVTSAQVLVSNHEMLLN